MGESAGLAVVPRPSVLPPHSDVLWRARGWRFAGFCVWMSCFPLAREGGWPWSDRDAWGSLPHPIPHVSDPRAAESHCWGSTWTCHRPWQSPSPASGPQSSFSAFCRRLGVPPGCADIHCRTLTTIQPFLQVPLRLETRIWGPGQGLWSCQICSLMQRSVGEPSLPVGTVSLGSSLSPSPEVASAYGICFSHLLESSVHTKAVALVTSSQPSSSHKTTQRVLALTALPVLAKLHLSQTETPPDPAHCQQVPRLSHPTVSQCLGKALGPLGIGRWPGEEGFAPRCSSRGRNGLWDTETAQPCCSSVWFHISYLCVLSAAIYGPWDDKLSMQCALPNSGLLLGKRKRAL